MIVSLTNSFLGSIERNKFKVDEEGPGGVEERCEPPLDVVDTIIALGVTTGGDTSDGCISPPLVGIGADMLLASMRSASSSRKDSSLDCFCCQKLEKDKYCYAVKN